MFGPRMPWAPMGVSTLSAPPASPCPYCVKCSLLQHHTRRAGTAANVAVPSLFWAEGEEVVLWKLYAN